MLLLAFRTAFGVARFYWNPANLATVNTAYLFCAWLFLYAGLTALFTQHLSIAPLLKWLSAMLAPLHFFIAH